MGHDGVLIHGKGDGYHPRRFQLAAARLVHANMALNFNIERVDDMKSLDVSLVSFEACHSFNSRHRANFKFTLR